MSQNQNLPSLENALTKEEIATWEKELDAALTFEDLKSVTASAVESKKISPEVKASLDERIDEAVLVDQNAENFIIAITNGSNPDQTEFDPIAAYDEKKNALVGTKGANQGQVITTDTEGFDIEKAIKKLRKPLQELADKIRLSADQGNITGEESFRFVVRELIPIHCEEKRNQAEKDLGKFIEAYTAELKSVNRVKIKNAIEAAKVIEKDKVTFDNMLPGPVRDLSDFQVGEEFINFARTYHQYDPINFGRN